MLCQTPGRKLSLLSGLNLPSFNLQLLPQAALGLCHFFSSSSAAGTAMGLLLTLFLSLGAFNLLDLCWLYPIFSAAILKWEESKQDMAILGWSLHHREGRVDNSSCSDAHAPPNAVKHIVYLIHDECTALAPVQLGIRCNTQVLFSRFSSPSVPCLYSQVCFFIRMYIRKHVNWTL